MSYLKNSFAFFAFFIFGFNQSFAQTTVTNNIYSDATWTAAGSPYIIPNTLVLFAGAVLTIDPGVTVEFGDGVTFDFRGKLIANGTASQHIVFTSSNPNPTVGIYNGFTLTGEGGTPNTITNQITMSYCDISYALEFMKMYWSLEGPFNFTNCYFYKNYYCFYAGPDYGDVNIDHCKFESNNYGAASNEGEYLHISNSTFLNNENGMAAHDISNSVFTGNQLGAECSHISHCELYGNEIGLYSDIAGDASVTDNYIHDNGTGLKIQRLFGSALSGNRICNNTDWNIEFQFTANADASNNCFCSTDSIYIRSKIKDGYVDPQYGLLSISIDNLCGEAGPTGIAVLNKEQKAKVYPNPFFNNTTIEFTYSSGHSYTIIITDQLGRKIKSVENIKSDKVVIERDNMPAGVYYYQLRDEQSLLSAGKIIAE